MSNSWLTSLHTHNQPLFENKENRDSSDNITVDQNAKDLSSI